MGLVINGKGDGRFMQLLETIGHFELLRQPSGVLVLRFTVPKQCQFLAGYFGRNADFTFFDRRETILSHQMKSNNIPHSELNQALTVGKHQIMNDKMENA